MAAENPRGLGRGTGVILTVVLVVTALRLAREVFLPLALATLFSFLLWPLVSILRRWRMGRIPSVLIAVVIAFAALIAVGTFLTGQLADLAHKLPDYQQNFEKKVQSVTKASGGIVGWGVNSVEKLHKELTPPAKPSPPTDGKPQEEKPTPVEVKNSNVSPVSVARSVLGSLFSVLVMAFIVTVFVIFMLVERDDLRRRIIRLLGHASPEATTKLLDEASSRVSTYLLMQFIVNVAYSIPVWLGLYFIGIPNAVLWGALSGLLRYIPYIGAWIAMSLPVILALAIDPNWSKPLMVLALFAVLEIIVANVIEPWLYGSSTGMTPLAVLIAAIFWTWLWGPLGLLLSTPLTVCLVSVGRYIPSFSFLNILFGEDPDDSAIKTQPKGNSAVPSPR